MNYRPQKDWLNSYWNSRSPIDFTAVTDPINTHNSCGIINGVKNAVTSCPDAMTIPSGKLFASGRPRIRLQVIYGIGNLLADTCRQIAIFAARTGFKFNFIRHSGLFSGDSRALPHSRNEIL
jgi:hypothetical protein